MTLYCGFRFGMILHDQLCTSYFITEDVYFIMYMSCFITEEIHEKYKFLGISLVHVMFHYGGNTWKVQVSRHFISTCHVSLWWNYMETRSFRAFHYVHIMFHYGGII